MKQVEYWRWKMINDLGQKVKSSVPMPAEDALRIDPKAERVLSSLEVRQVPETHEEKMEALYPRRQPNGAPPGS